MSDAKLTPRRRRGENREGAACGYFVRDDDVGELTDELQALAETFAGRGIPVSYQVIPARLTTQCADYLLSIHRQHPELVEFGQHGLHHRMTLKGRELKREFGPERSLEEQVEAINSGRELLRQALGHGVPIEVFTPPQHKFDGNTVRAAAGAGHRIFSAACYATPHHQLAYAVGRRMGLGSVRHHGISYDGDMRPEAPILEISIAIDVDDGRQRKRDAAALERTLGQVALRRDYVGLMFHHALYSTPEARRELEAIAQALAVRGTHLFAGLRATASSVSD